MLKSTLSGVSPRGAILLFVLSLAFLPFGGALVGQSNDAPGPFRTQVIELQAGWNAVYLEVEPLESTPAALLAETPVEIVAAYFRPSTSLEFIDDPSTLLGDRKGWNVWYAPERDDALLSNLYSIQAHRAYLVFSNEDYTWNLEGTPYFDAVQWYPNSFSLVGFSVDTANAPTVENFFQGSQAHDPLKIYSMVDGRWLLIDEPASTLMQAGVGYWVVSNGASDFSGPFKVSFAGDSAGGLTYTQDSSSRRLVIENVASYPQSFTLLVEPGNEGTIPLAYLVTALNGAGGTIESISVDFPPELTIPSIEPGESLALDLEVVQDQVSTPLLGSNFVIRSDAGLRVDIPIISIRNDLSGE